MGVVEDQILIEPCEKGVMLNANFEIRFIKNTFWKRVIQNTTCSEFHKWFTSYEENVRNALNQTSLVETPELLEFNPIDTVVKPEPDEPDDVIPSLDLIL